MENNYSPAVITSRKAQDHFDDIKFQHTNILQGMQEQSMKVAQFNSEKQAQQQIVDQETKASKMENDKMNLEGQAKILEQQNKAQELAIKQQTI